MPRARRHSFVVYSFCGSEIGHRAVLQVERDIGNEFFHIHEFVVGRLGEE